MLDPTNDRACPAEDSGGLALSPSDPSPQEWLETWGLAHGTALVPCASCARWPGSLLLISRRREERGALSQACRLGAKALPQAWQC